MIRSDQAMTAFAEADLERRLRALPPAPGPDARFRAELRTQLLAAVERGPAADLFAPDRAQASVRSRPRFVPVARRGPARVALSFRQLSPFLPPTRRVLALLSAAMAVVLVITGTTYWLAQRALPGDALYGLKRASETVDLSTKGGAINRGSAYLSISSTRIDEAFELVKRDSSAAAPGVGRGRVGISAAGPLSAHVDQLVYGVLTDGDTAAVAATRLLTTASIDDRALQPAASVSTWLVDQQGKVRDLVARLPERAPSTAGGAARHLQRDLIQIQTRVKAIAASAKCTTCRFTKSDRLGPLPCQLCPTPAPTPTPTTARSTNGTTTPNQATSTVAVGTTTGSPTVVPSGPGSGLPSSTGTTGSTTTAPPPTTPTPSTPAPPPLTTPTTPSDTGTPEPATTAPPPPTSPPTTVDPTVPSVPTCLPAICTDSPVDPNTETSPNPTDTPSS